MTMTWEEKLSVLNDETMAILGGQNVDSRVRSIGVTPEKSVSVEVLEMRCDGALNEDSLFNSYPDSKEQFDFLHIRWQNQYFNEGPRIFKQAFQQTKPDGWVEVLEIDPSKSFSSSGWSHLSCSKRGGIFSIGPTGYSHKQQNVSLWIKNQLLDAGFVDVEEKVWEPSTSSWQKFRDLGCFLRTVFTLGICRQSNAEKPDPNAAVPISAQNTPMSFVIARHP